ncbi:MAG: hypothetical protein B6242_12710 [Anaerolineaceae bacterium 4572_78]|nr:MAG: hypothetical protein B6242_12710 [Anaerolineaceae bacterium 4572_78]
MFFIVGRGRSGTTLFSMMLEMHPELCVATESLFLVSLYNKYSKGKWSKKRIDSFFEDIWRESWMEDWNLDKPVLKEKLLALGDSATFSQLCDIIYREYACQRNKPTALIGQKDPHFSFFLDRLLETFPFAKFIHVVRDCRDSILSYQKVNFDTNNPYALAYRWKAHNEAIQAFGKDHPAQYLVIRYEDILCEPESVMRKVCQFLGIKYTPTIIQVPDKQAVIFDHLIKTTQPLDPSNKNKWQTKMDKKTLLGVEAICHHTMRHYGYSLANKPIVRVPLFTLPGLLWGWLLTFLERLLFQLPLSLRSAILNVYRTVTASNKIRLK